MQILFQKPLMKNLSKDLNLHSQRPVKSHLISLKDIKRKRDYNNTITGIELSKQERLQKQLINLN